MANEKPEQKPAPTPPAAEQKPAPAPDAEANQDLPINQPNYPPSPHLGDDPYFDSAGQRPVPQELQDYKYTHTACGTENEMDNRTYYLWYCYPWLVTGLYCKTCRTTIRVGEDGEIDMGGGKAIPPVDTVPYVSAPVPGAPGFYNSLHPSPQEIELPPPPPAPEPGAK